MPRLLGADDFPVRLDAGCSLQLAQDVFVELPDGGAAVTAEGELGHVTLDLGGHRLAVGGVGASAIRLRGRDASLSVLRGVLGPCTGPAVSAAGCAAVLLEDVRVEGFCDAGVLLEDVKESTLRRVELRGGSGSGFVAGLQCEAGARPAGLTATGLRVHGLRADRVAAVLLRGLRRARLAAVEVSAVRAVRGAIGLDARCVEVVLDSVSVRDVSSDGGDVEGLRVAGVAVAAAVTAEAPLLRE